MKRADRVGGGAWLRGALRRMPRTGGDADRPQPAAGSRVRRSQPSARGFAASMTTCSTTRRGWRSPSARARRANNDAGVRPVSMMGGGAHRGASHHAAAKEIRSADTRPQAQHARVSGLVRPYKRQLSGLVAMIHSPQVAQAPPRVLERDMIDSIVERQSRTALLRSAHYSSSRHGDHPIVTGVTASRDLSSNRSARRYASNAARRGRTAPAACFSSHFFTRTPQRRGAEAASRTTLRVDTVVTKTSDPDRPRT